MAPVIDGAGVRVGPDLGDPSTGRLAQITPLLIDPTGRSLWQLIDARAELTPGKVFARDEAGRTMTYGEYREAALRAAAGFADLGVVEGTIVSWILPSRIEAFVLTGALAYLGAIQNPILPIYRHREIGFILRQTGARFLVMPGVFRGVDYAAMGGELVEATGTTLVVADPDLPQGDPTTLGPPVPSFVDGGWRWRWVFYSSGTTADPKGAKHTDRSLSAANDGMQWAMQVGPDDTAAVVFPITHVGGLVWTFNAMQTGVELLLVEAFSPAETWKFLREHGVTCAGAGTVFFQSYLATQRQHPELVVFPDVRIFNGGGAPKPPTLHGEMMAEMHAPIIGGWGLTEAPIDTMAHVDAPDVKKAETEGGLVPGTSARVVTVEGAIALDPDVEGELRIKGPQVCLGYVDASLDAEAFDDDGWFRTGDLGAIDAEGYVRITGRLKDVIIRKGENISAKEVEDLLHTHPAVREAAVIGIPDDERGELACAVVALVPGAELPFDEMVSFLCGAQLSMHKVPERLEIVDALPRNPTGKVLKRDMRTQYSK
jgi:acyl-CoA synthetase (AMP-forming)/AMP-acid ligase II